jgi:ribosomal protein S3AE
MKVKATEPAKKICNHAFEVGDVIASYSHDNKRVITGIEHAEGQSCIYKFMELEDDYTNRTISGHLIEIKKGNMSEQPCYIVDKYFCLVEYK